MFFIGAAQPHMAQVDGPADATTMLIHTERQAFCDKLASGEHPDVDIVVDHAGGEKGMADVKRWQDVQGGAFKVESQKRIGRLHEAFMDEHKNLHVVGELFYNRPETRAIIEGINKKEGAGKEDWGLSLCTDLGRTFGHAHNKHVSHIGITRNPDYGEEGTWLHEGTQSSAKLDDLLREYTARPGYYFAEATRRRYHGGDAGGSGGPTRLSVAATASKSSLLTPLHVLFCVLVPVV